MRLLPSPRLFRYRRFQLLLKHIATPSAAAAYAAASIPSRAANSSFSTITFHHHHRYRLAALLSRPSLLQAITSFKINCSKHRRCHSFHNIADVFATPLPSLAQYLLPYPLSRPAPLYLSSLISQQRSSLLTPLPSAELTAFAYAGNAAKFTSNSTTLLLSNALSQPSRSPSSPHLLCCSRHRPTSTLLA